MAAWWSPLVTLPALALQAPNKASHPSKEV